MHPCQFPRRASRHTCPRNSLAASPNRCRTLPMSCKIGWLLAALPVRAIASPLRGFEVLVTAATVPAVAVAASAGFMGLPQGPDSQCHNACQYQQNDNFSRSHGLLPLTARRPRRPAAGRSPHPDNPCGTAGRGFPPAGPEPQWFQGQTPPLR